MALVNTAPGQVHVRPFHPRDAAPLTTLLHEAYGQLAAMGLNFTAVDQDEATTVSRARAGHCLVAEIEGRIVGTGTFSMPPYAPLIAQWAPAAEPGTVWLNQLAVDPSRQGLGVARSIFDVGLAWSRVHGAKVIGLDTAEPATHLVELYRRWGFEARGTIQWEGKTYRSVVMTRELQ